MSSPSQPMVVHNVYFTLAEDSAAARRNLVESCRKYLAGHPGVVYFSAGILSDALDRPVNDREFDVGLHIVFRSMADHDEYQKHPRHLQFIAENKSSWKLVRVFDSEVD